MGSFPPGSPAGSSPSAVNAAANLPLSRQASPTPAPLSSAEPPKNPLQEKFEVARRFFNDNKLEDARVLFDEIIRDLPSTGANLLLLADCRIFLTHIYLEGSDERFQSAIEAKKTVDLIYENRSSWDDLDIDRKTAQYQLLRMLLEQLFSLMPDTLESLKADIPSKIEECNCHIPLINDFHHTILLGIQFFTEVRIDLARDFFVEALEMIEGRSEPDYLLAQAFGMTNLALTYPSGDDGRNRWAFEAIRPAFAAYEQKEALFKIEKSKLTALNFFCQLFESLSQITPNVDMQTECKEKLKECRRELDRLSASAATGGSLEAKTTPPGSKVSKDPVDPWKAAKLFIAFGFATVVVVGALVLGKRYITRLN